LVPPVNAQAVTPTQTPYQAFTRRGVAIFAILFTPPAMASSKDGNALRTGVRPAGGIRDEKSDQTGPDLGSMHLHQQLRQDQGPMRGPL